LLATIGAKTRKSEKKSMAAQKHVRKSPSGWGFWAALKTRNFAQKLCCVRYYYLARGLKPRVL